MSIFSSKKKKAAEREKKAASEAEANRPKSAPYFHTPTHAARDFLSSTPSSFVGQHRAQIIEQQHRQSLMTRTMSEQNGKAPMSGSSTPAKRSSSQISSSGSMIADYPPVITVQRTRPNPFLPASAQPNYEAVNEVPPMPTIPHRYSSPVAPKVENKTLMFSRPFSNVQKSGYIRSPLSTSNHSPVESDDNSPISSAHSSSRSSMTPSIQPSTQTSTHSSTYSSTSPTVQPSTYVTAYPSTSSSMSPTVQPSTYVSAQSSMHSGIPSQAPQPELKKVRENGQEVFRTYAKTPIFEVSEMPPPPLPAPLPLSEMPPNLQTPRPEVQPEKTVTGKKERRRTLFGLGRRRSSVAAN